MDSSMPPVIPVAVHFQFEPDKKEGSVDDSKAQ